jgi:hypothetical protein
VQLVEEQQDPPFGGLHLGQHRPQALLELAAVLRAGHQQTHVEGEDGAGPQPLRDVATGDPLGQALDDRGLPDAGVADEHRVVLGLAGQDLDHPTDLGVAADHRIPLPGTSGRDQVLPILGQRLVGALRGGRPDALVAAHRGELAEERVAGDAVPGQHPTGRAALGFGDHGHQQVLDGDVLVGEPPGLLLGLVEERGQPRRDHDLALRGATRAGRARDALQLGLDVGGQPVHVDAHRVEQPRHQPSGCWSARAAGAASRPRRGRPGRGVLRRGNGLLGLLGQPVEVHQEIHPRVASCAARCVRSASSSRPIRSSSSTTRPSAA